LELERRLAGRFDPGPGGGAAGGLGAALASLGASLESGAALVLDALGFDSADADLVVTGEGRVDVTTALGKAPGEVARRCVEAGTRCVVFGGVVDEPLPGVEMVSLSGEPALARADLRELGRELARKPR
jgi:glycerate kinase